MCGTLTKMKYLFWELKKDAKKEKGIILHEI
jgi:hypothetical protein